MKRRIWIMLPLLTHTMCLAQQPNVRVRLWSLFKTTQIEIAPLGKTKIRWGNDSPAQAIDQLLLIGAQGDNVRLDGREAAKLTVSGDFRMSAGGAPVQHVRAEVEVSAHAGELQAIGVLPMEDYVAVVLQGETAGQMAPEALKSLAVAIRSYAVRSRERHKEEGFDFCDSTHCQYLRMEVGRELRAAVKATSGELLWDRGSPLAAYHHKDCGGQTEAAEAVWPDQKSSALVSHSDPYCVRTAAPWKSELNRKDIDKALLAAGFRVPRDWNRIVVSERASSGRARTLQFRVGSQPLGTPVSASAFRFALGRALGWSTLKSDLYDVASQSDRITFTGKGVGHGVGLCQTGAAEMARQGHTYREILAFYYPTAIPGRSAQGIPWRVLQGDAFELHAVNPGDIETVRNSAHSAIEWAKQRSGLGLVIRPVIEVYPSVAMFRDATGEPGWVAASTRGLRIRLQPPPLLSEKIDSVLRHEFLHMIVENNAHRNSPLWFREGLVVYLEGNPPAADRGTLSTAEIERAITSRSNRRDVLQAYSEAAGLVGELDRRHGRAKLMEWLRNGLPDDLRIPVGAPGEEVTY